MICPSCKNGTHIEIDTHSDGFAPNLQECGDCGTLWTSQTDDTEIVIHGPTSEYAANG
jgi:hypothetical protein